MRSARFAYFIGFLLTITIPVLAQQLPVSSGVATPQQDEKAASLLKASLAALMGSTTTLPSTLAESGTTTPFKGDSTESFTVRIYMQGMDKFRWEADLQNGTTATVINGQQEESQIASASSPLMAWQVAARKLENFPLFLLSHWLNANDIQERFVGLEKIDGQALNHVAIVDYSQRIGPPNLWRRNNHRGEYELYLDPATSLPVRLHYYQETDDRYFLSLAPMVIVYSDFRVVAGSMFPFTLTRYINQTKLSVLQLQSVVPDAAVAASAFQIN